MRRLRVQELRAALPEQATEPEIPSDVFDALVVAWTEILVADYERRYGGKIPGQIQHQSESGDGEEGC